jgi:hypothetical protein
VLCSLVLCAASWAPPSHAREALPPAVAARVRALALWEDTAWLRLLHYRSEPFNGFSSEVDGAAFFLSPRGYTDPKAELFATLRAFQRPIGNDPERHARCRFPARFHWLDQKLGLSAALPPLRCAKLEAFAARYRPDYVALMYAANSVDNPVSAFGHTFMVLKRAGPARRDVAVEYTPDTDTHNPLLYAFKGLTGMYRGRYRFHALSDKARYYLEEEGRDLWEYELALTRAEELQLIRHLWELSFTHFDYYYMSENCSYGMLAVLEAAVPRLELIEHTKFVVAPVDTVRALFETPGLVRNVRHRAARHDGSAPLRQQSPHRGHDSMRVVLGTGFTSQYADGFGTLGYRIALHDLADPPAGQPGLSQVGFMDIRVRYEAERRRFTLNELTFAELMTLHPLGVGFRPSWRARGYGLRLRDPGCKNQDCFAHGIDGSLGVSAATRGEVLTAFAMADAYVLFSGQLDGIGGSFVRAGVGPFAGVRLDADDAVVLLVTSSFAFLPGQATGTTYDVRGALRARLTNDVALGTEALLQPSAFEAQLLSYLYF